MRAYDELLPHTREFDTIAVSGITGMLVGPWLAELLHKSLAIVRKPGDTHSHGPASDVEGYIGSRYIIVDDHISSGRTVIQIQRKIAAVKPSALYVGSYMYDDPFLGTDLSLRP
jgi:adenine/guanine phosphoribosyltransferase-like PRPP-binding protein